MTGVYVMTLAISRQLIPSSEAAAEHQWGSNWLAMPEIKGLTANLTPRSKIGNLLQCKQVTGYVLFTEKEISL